jgi:hypothetical protein
VTSVARVHRVRTFGVGAAIVALALAACQPGVAVPPDSATPEVVLDAYLRALVAGDCAIGRKLAVPTFQKGNGELCGSTGVTGFRIEPPPARPSADEVVFFSVLRTTGSDDGSIQPGEIGWFYSLQRQPSGPWRITGGGTGP